MNLIVIISILLTCLYITSAARSLVGRRCRYKKINGRCRDIKKCSSAISNLYAGVKPPTCSKENGQVIVCCLTEKRISEKKCDEYLSSIKKNLRPMPLLPMAFMGRNSYKSPTHCAINPNRLIVGGRNAISDEFPYTVAIGFGPESKTRWFCGGTLISPDFVLTAAHCIDRETPQRVLLGDISISPTSESSSREIIEIDKIITHPLYEPPLIYNDLALIKLTREVDFSESILPACLPSPGKRFDRFKIFQVTGWGLLGYGENQSDILQAVNLTRYGQKECSRFFNDRSDKSIRFPEGIVRSNLCAGDKRRAKDSCQGDSGGPLAVKIFDPCAHYIIGIVSFGSKYCGNNEPAIYTNVQSYLDWIESIVWPRI